MSNRPDGIRRDLRAGFTMIEMLIALLVLVGGMVSVLALFSTSVSVHRSAVDEARVALLAEEALDRIRTEWSETGDLSRFDSLELADASARPYRVDADIEPIDDTGAALAVVIRVSWVRGRGERTARFESVILRDAFGPNVRALRAGTPAPLPGSTVEGDDG